MHPAKWMFKAIYVLKVCMFLGQFKLSVREEKGLREITIFIRHLYPKTWTLSPKSVAVSRHNLKWLKDLPTYMDVT